MARVRAAAAALLTVLALAAPATAYGNDSNWRGECRFATVNTDGATWEGALYSDVMPYSETHNNVVNATVTCHLLINGVDVLQLSGSGSGAVVFADRLTFTAVPGTVVELCTEVDFTSDPTPNGWDCGAQVETPIWPAQYLADWLGWGLDTVSHGLVTYVDPALCAQTDGDVYVGGEWLWDCPPYDFTPPGDPGPPPAPPAPPRVPTGAGWNDGDTGFLALTSTTTARDVAATCAFRTDRDNGTITVTGAAATARAVLADQTRLRCVLKDAATGAVLFDRDAAVNGPVATVHDVLAAIPGKVTVCTEGSGTWGTETVTVGPYCRPGLPI